MCNRTALVNKRVELEDYLEYINTSITTKMRDEPEVYTAYAAHNDLDIPRINEWYIEAEGALITALFPDTYIARKYDLWTDAGIDAAIDKEIADGTLYECGGYWFRKE